MFSRCGTPSRSALSAFTNHIAIVTLVLFSICVVQPVATQSASDYYVKSLPGAPEGPLLKMHAGHIEVTPEHHGNLFFWLFQNRHIGDRQRTVIWLNGGPGCSSMDGALMEIGPYRVDESGKLSYNEGSWDEFANVLFVDQPVGTGFSFVDTDSYVEGLDQDTAQFITFLEKWFKIFPEFVNDDLYIAGESYAGQYIPAFADAILKKSGKSGFPKLNLKGLLIGNGWINGVDQYPSYLKFAYKKGLVEQGSSIAKQLELKQAECMRKIEQDGTDHVDLQECENVLQDVMRLTLDRNAPNDQQCINMYDVRLRDSYPECGSNWPVDLSTVTPYLRKKDVLTALHVSKDKNTGWRECSGAVGSHFRVKEPTTPVIKLLPEILKTVPIVLFSGAEDLICNHLGTEELIHNLEWNGGKGFQLSGVDTWAPRREWTFEGKPAGIYQEARNLTYVLFYNSSHMVPYDYARRSRDMLDRFMGVDIASIGGTPADSRLDGEKGLETSVGGHPNSTIAQEKEQEKLQGAKWDAYYRSGEAALVIVVIAASVWGWFVWRERRKHRGYQGVAGSSTNGMGPFRETVNAVARGAGLENLRRHKADQTDLEAADFDANEVDNMKPQNDANQEKRRYSLGSLSSDGDDDDDDDDAEEGHRKDNTH